ncbi:MAG: hypothetical protein KGD60_09945 [Candidatus Thorarchaeota archaeon]|nr:hypothetical protein [Candidatus Thorarchaeota archaeon]
MPRSAREVPKEIAAFGERQFKETGAVAVEVLRVKAAVMRKHFRQLKGITFLVAVVSLDRVRIYFFNSAGVMLVGDNVEPSMYQKVRASSKLIAKFEKPRELTPEEQRIEATQELRDSLAKSLRRVTRFLSTASPTFPDIFVTRSSSEDPTQSFGLQITDGGEHLFEESALKTNWFDGLITRTAFLAHLDPVHSRSQIASVVGNGIALALMKDPGRKAFRDFWLKISKDTEWFLIVNHLIKHADCYTSEGFVRLQSLLRLIPSSSQVDDWAPPFKVIHDSARVSIGTEEYHTIQGFCKTLSKPRKLNLRKHRLESIHLAPRAICDPTPLDTQISLSHGKPSDEDWATVSFLDGRKVNTLKIGRGEETPVAGFEYWLNLEDVYPTSGGLVSHGKSVLRRALATLGVSSKSIGTFEATLEFSDTILATNETAVLERLILGNLDVLANTLVGSPQIVGRLLTKGKIVFLPSFNHIGVNMDYLLKGEVDVVQSIVRQHTLEATTFKTDKSSIAIVSAPSTWRTGLLDSVAVEGISIWPIISTTSQRNILRSEDPFLAGKLVTWTD